MRSFVCLLCACLFLAQPALAWPGKGTVELTITMGTLERSYTLHIPRNLPKDQPAALVLMFHGGGGTPKFAERDSGFSKLADREGFIVAYPRGIGKSWNDGRNDPNIEAHKQNIDDVGFASAVIDDIARYHPIDSKRIFATGISNGATFSNHLGVRISSRIAAIAPVVGGLSPQDSTNFTPVAPVAALIIQSINDPIVPYAGGNISLPFGISRGSVMPTETTVRQWVTHNGCQRVSAATPLPDLDADDGCRATRVSYSQCRGGADVTLYKLDGESGHTWPDGAQYLPKRVVGSVCRDIDGAKEIWNFFKAHPKQ